MHGVRARGELTASDLTNVNRIRIRAIDLSTPLHDQFFQSGPIIPTATSFTIPPNELQFGRSYGFGAS